MHLSDVLVTPCTHWYKLGHVVCLTIELLMLGVNGHAGQAGAAHAAQEVVLMVQLVTSLHGPVCDGAMAGGADHWV